MSSIKVAVRVRPLTKREIDKRVKFVVEANSTTLSIQNPKLENDSHYGDSRERVKHFLFDYVYMSADPDTPTNASQEMVFQDLGTDVLEAAFAGYNACVFAYGQTGSGKTHTMMGYPGEAGLIPRISEGLFGGVDDLFDVHATFKISVSYLEIYNERVRDLLRPASTKQGDKYTLKVREHPKEGPYVQDLSWHSVKDNDALQALIDKGNGFRTTAATHMHELSSRSHAIFTVIFTQAKLEADHPSELVSKVNLVDLAGSERADSAYNKGRLKEGANINKSLVTLGNVIKALAERSLWSWSTESVGSLDTASLSFRSSSAEGVAASSPTSSPSSTPGASPSAKKPRSFYIPYRDSVLTWMLKDSLGGNAKTIMIATISPSSLYYRETINTLRYAQRAKNIVNKPTINEDPNVKLIRELKGEIERLRCMLVNANMPLSELNPSVNMSASPSNQGSKKYRNIETQASSLSALTDTGYYISERLEQNEARARELTNDWMCKWQSAHEIMRESDMSIRTLSRRSSSTGVIVDSQLPHLIGMDDDILSTGVVMYHLREGHTRVGREDAPQDQDIVLSGPCIEAEHCMIRNDDGEVMLRPISDAVCTVNGVEVAGPMKLSQGDVILLGKTNMFRFNNPAEAVRLREHRRSLFGDSRLPGALSRCSSWSSLNTSSGVDIESPASSPVSPLMMQNPGPSWMDVCLELERQYRTESERIQKAKQELERLRDEHRAAETQRQEREQDLWRRHEAHRADVERQKRLLSALVHDSEQHQIRAENEIQRAREQLEVEQRLNAETLDTELLAISELESQQVALFGGEGGRDQGVQTDGGVFDELAVPTSSIAGDDTSPVTVAAVAYTDAVHRHMNSTVPGRRKQLVQTQLLQQLSLRDAEITIAMQQQDLEDRLFSDHDRIRAERQRLREAESAHKTEASARLQTVARDVDFLHTLEAKQMQLEAYIAEKMQWIDSDTERQSPLGESTSEESISATSSPRITTDRGAIPKDAQQRPLASQHLYHKVPHHSPLLDRANSAHKVAPSMQNAAPDPFSKTKKPASIAEKVTARLFPKQQSDKQKHAFLRRRSAGALHSRTRSAPILFPGPGQSAKQELERRKRCRSTSPEVFTNEKQRGASHAQRMLLRAVNPRLRLSSSSLASVPEPISEIAEETFDQDYTEDSSDVNNSAGSLEWPPGGKTQNQTLDRAKFRQGDGQSDDMACEAESVILRPVHLNVSKAPPSAKANSEEAVSEKSPRVMADSHETPHSQNEDSRADLDGSNASLSVSSVSESMDTSLETVIPDVTYVTKNPERTSLSPAATSETSHHISSPSSPTSSALSSPSSASAALSSPSSASAAGPSSLSSSSLLPQHPSSASETSHELSSKNLKLDPGFSREDLSPATDVNTPSEPESVYVPTTTSPESVYVPTTTSPESVYVPTTTIPESVYKPQTDGAADVTNIHDILPTSPADVPTMRDILPTSPADVPTMRDILPTSSADVPTMRDILPTSPADVTLGGERVSQSAPSSNEPSSTDVTDSRSDAPVMFQAPLQNTLDFQMSVTERPDPPQTSHGEESRLTLADDAGDVKDLPQTRSDGPEEDEEEEGVTASQNAASGRSSKQRPPLKRGMRRESPRGEMALSRPKRRFTSDDIPVEIYLPGGGGYGSGGGGASLALGNESEADPFRSSNDPSHDLFAKSLRQPSPEWTQKSFTPDFGHGNVKIIVRRKSDSAFYAKDKRRRKQVEQCFVPRKLPNGRSSSLDADTQEDAPVVMATDESVSQVSTLPSDERHGEEKYSDDSLNDASDASPDTSESISPAHPGLSASGSPNHLLKSYFDNVRERLEQEHETGYSDDSLEHHRHGNEDAGDVEMLPPDSGQFTQSWPGGATAGYTWPLSSSVTEPALHAASVPAVFIPQMAPPQMHVTPSGGAPGEQSMTTLADRVQRLEENQQELLQERYSPVTVGPSTSVTVASVPTKSTPANVAKKSSRQRSSRRRPVERDSSEADHLSDDSIVSGNMSSSRPGSGRRRKKPTRYVDSPKKARVSSEEYDLSSGSESVYSEDSLVQSDDKQMDIDEDLNLSPGVASELSHIKASIDALTSAIHERGVLVADSGLPDDSASADSRLPGNSGLVSDGIQDKPQTSSEPGFVIAPTLRKHDSDVQERALGQIFSQVRSADVSGTQSGDRELPDPQSADVITPEASHNCDPQCIASEADPQSDKLNSPSKSKIWDDTPVPFNIIIDKSIVSKDSSNVDSFVASTHRPSSSHTVSKQQQRMQEECKVTQPLTLGGAAVTDSLSIAPGVDVIEHSSPAMHGCSDPRVSSVCQTADHEVKGKMSESMNVACDAPDTAVNVSGDDSDLTHRDVSNDNQFLSEQGQVSTPRVVDPSIPAQTFIIEESFTPVISIQTVNPDVASNVSPAANESVSDDKSMKPQPSSLSPGEGGQRPLQPADGTEHDELSSLRMASVDSGVADGSLMQTGSTIDDFTVTDMDSPDADSVFDLSAKSSSLQENKTEINSESPSVVRDKSIIDISQADIEGKSISDFVVRDDKDSLLSRLPEVGVVSSSQTLLPVMVDEHGLPTRIHQEKPHPSDNIQNQTVDYHDLPYGANKSSNELLVNQQQNHPAQHEQSDSSPDSLKSIDQISPQNISQHPDSQETAESRGTYHTDNIKVQDKESLLTVDPSLIPNKANISTDQDLIQKSASADSVSTTVAIVGGGQTVAPPCDVKLKTAELQHEAEPAIREGVWPGLIHQPLTNTAQDPDVFDDIIVWQDPDQTMVLDSRIQNVASRRNTDSDLIGHVKSNKSGERSVASVSEGMLGLPSVKDSYNKACDGETIRRSHPDAPASIQPDRAVQSLRKQAVGLSCSSEELSPRHAAAGGGLAKHSLISASMGELSAQGIEGFPRKKVASLSYSMEELCGLPQLSPHEAYIRGIPSPLPCHKRWPSAGSDLSYSGLYVTDFEGDFYSSPRLVQSDLISQHYSEQSGQDSSSDEGEVTDPGVYTLVHFKAPQWRKRSKRKHKEGKVSATQPQDLSMSQMLMLKFRQPNDVSCYLSNEPENEFAVATEVMSIDVRKPRERIMARLSGSEDSLLSHDEGAEGEVTNIQVDGAFLKSRMMKIPVKQLTPAAASRSDQREDENDEQKEEAEKRQSEKLPNVTDSHKEMDTHQQTEKAEKHQDELEKLPNVTDSHKEMDTHQQTEKAEKHQNELEKLPNVTDKVDNSHRGLDTPDLSQQESAGYDNSKIVNEHEDLPELNRITKIESDDCDMDIKEQTNPVTDTTDGSALTESAINELRIPAIQGDCGETTADRHSIANPNEPRIPGIQGDCGETTADRHSRTNPNEPRIPAIQGDCGETTADRHSSANQLQFIQDLMSDDSAEQPSAEVAEMEDESAEVAEMTDEDFEGLEIEDESVWYERVSSDEEERGLAMTLLINPALAHHLEFTNGENDYKLPVITEESESVESNSPRHHTQAYPGIHDLPEICVTDDQGHHQVAEVQPSASSLSEDSKQMISQIMVNSESDLQRALANEETGKDASSTEKSPLVQEKVNIIIDEDATRASFLPEEMSNEDHERPTQENSSALFADQDMFGEETTAISTSVTPNQVANIPMIEGAFGNNPNVVHDQSLANQIDNLDNVPSVTLSVSGNPVNVVDPSTMNLAESEDSEVLSGTSVTAMLEEGTCQASERNPDAHQSCDQWEKLTVRDEDGGVPDSEVKRPETKDTNEQGNNNEITSINEELTDMQSSEHLIDSDVMEVSEPSDQNTNTNFEHNTDETRQCITKEMIEYSSDADDKNETIDSAEDESNQGRQKSRDVENKSDRSQAEAGYESHEQTTDSETARADAQCESDTLLSYETSGDVHHNVVAKVIPMETDDVSNSDKTGNTHVNEVFNTTDQSEVSVISAHSEAGVPTSTIEGTAEPIRQSTELEASEMVDICDEAEGLLQAQLERIEAEMNREDVLSVVMAEDRTVSPEDVTMTEISDAQDPKLRDRKVIIGDRNEIEMTDMSERNNQQSDQQTDAQKDGRESPKEGLMAKLVEQAKEKILRRLEEAMPEPLEISLEETINEILAVEMSQVTETEVDPADLELASLIEAVQRERDILQNGKTTTQTGEDQNGSTTFSLKDPIVSDREEIAEPVSSKWSSDPLIVKRRIVELVPVRDTRDRMESRVKDVNTITDDSVFICEIESTELTASPREGNQMKTNEGLGCEAMPGTQTLEEVLHDYVQQHFIMLEKSQSDSAISSDYNTDNESATVSPKTRLYDSNKVLYDRVAVPGVNAPNQAALAQAYKGLVKITIPKKQAEDVSRENAVGGLIKAPFKDSGNVDYSDVKEPNSSPIQNSKMSNDKHNFEQRVEQHDDFEEMPLNLSTESRALDDSLSQHLGNSQTLKIKEPERSYATIDKEALMKHYGLDDEDQLIKYPSTSELLSEIQSCELIPLERPRSLSANDIWEPQNGYTRAFSTDSITYVFMSRAHSVDQFPEDFPLLQRSRHQSEPVGPSAESSVADYEEPAQNVVPVAERSVSAECLLTFKTKDPVTRNRSASMDATRLKEKELQRQREAEEREPGAIFGGMNYSEGDSIDDIVERNKHLLSAESIEFLRLRKLSEMELDAECDEDQHDDAHSQNKPLPSNHETIVMNKATVDSLTPEHLRQIKADKEYNTESHGERLHQDKESVRSENVKIEIDETIVIPSTDDQTDVTNSSPEVQHDSVQPLLSDSYRTVTNKPDKAVMRSRSLSPHVMSQLQTMTSAPPTGLGAVLDEVSAAGHRVITGGSKRKRTKSEASQTESSSDSMEMLDERQNAHKLPKDESHDTERKSQDRIPDNEQTPHYVPSHMRKNLNDTELFTQSSADMSALLPRRQEPRRVSASDNNRHDSWRNLSALNLEIPSRPFNRTDQQLAIYDMYNMHQQMKAKMKIVGETMATQTGDSLEDDLDKTICADEAANAAKPVTIAMATQTTDSGLNTVSSGLSSVDFLDSFSLPESDSSSVHPQSSPGSLEELLPANQMYAHAMTSTPTYPMSDVRTDEESGVYSISGQQFGLPVDFGTQTASAAELGNAGHVTESAVQINPGDLHLSREFSMQTSPVNVTSTQSGGDVCHGREFSMQTSPVNVTSTQSGGDVCHGREFSVQTSPVNVTSTQSGGDVCHGREFSMQTSPVNVTSTQSGGDVCNGREFSVQTSPVNVTSTQSGGDVCHGREFSVQTSPVNVTSTQSGGDVCNGREFSVQTSPVNVTSTQSGGDVCHGREFSMQTSAVNVTSTQSGGDVCHGREFSMQTSPVNVTSTQSGGDVCHGREFSVQTSPVNVTSTQSGGDVCHGREFSMQTSPVNVTSTQSGGDVCPVNESPDAEQASQSSDYQEAVMSSEAGSDQSNAINTRDQTLMGTADVGSPTCSPVSGHVSKNEDEQTPSTHNDIIPTTQDSLTCTPPTARNILQDQVYDMKVNETMGSIEFSTQTSPVELETGQISPTDFCMQTSPVDSSDDESSKPVEFASQTDINMLLNATSMTRPFFSNGVNSTMALVLSGPSEAGTQTGAVDSATQTGAQDRGTQTGATDISTQTGAVELSTQTWEMEVAVQAEVNDPHLVNPAVHKLIGERRTMSEYASQTSLDEWDENESSRVVEISTQTGPGTEDVSNEDVETESSRMEDEWDENESSRVAEISTQTGPGTEDVSNEDVETESSRIEDAWQDDDESRRRAESCTQTGPGTEDVSNEHVETESSRIEDERQDDESRRREESCTQTGPGTEDVSSADHETSRPSYQLSTESTSPNITTDAKAELSLPNYQPSAESTSPSNATDVDTAVDFSEDAIRSSDAIPTLNSTSAYLSDSEGEPTVDEPLIVPSRFDKNYYMNPSVLSPDEKILNEDGIGIDVKADLNNHSSESYFNEEDIMATPQLDEMEEDKTLAELVIPDNASLSSNPVAENIAVSDEAMQKAHTTIPDDDTTNPTRELENPKGIEINDIKSETISDLASIDSKSLSKSNQMGSSESIPDFDIPFISGDAMKDDTFAVAAPSSSEDMPDVPLSQPEDTTDLHIPGSSAHHPLVSETDSETVKANDIRESDEHVLKTLSSDVATAADAITEPKIDNALRIIPSNDVISEVSPQHDESYDEDSVASKTSDIEETDPSIVSPSQQQQQQQPLSDLALQTLKELDFPPLSELALQTLLELERRTPEDTLHHPDVSDAKRGTDVTDRKPYEKADVSVDHPQYDLSTPSLESLRAEYDRLLGVLRSREDEQNLRKRLRERRRQEALSVQDQIKESESKPESKSDIDEIHDKLKNIRDDTETERLLAEIQKSIADEEKKLKDDLEEKSVLNISGVSDECDLSMEEMTLDLEKMDSIKSPDISLALDEIAAVLDDTDKKTNPDDIRRDVKEGRLDEEKLKNFNAGFEGRPEGSVAVHKYLEELGHEMSRERPSSRTSTVATQWDLEEASSTNASPRGPVSVKDDSIMAQGQISKVSPLDSQQAEKSDASTWTPSSMMQVDNQVRPTNYQNYLLNAQQDMLSPRSTASGMSNIHVDFESDQLKLTGAEVTSAKYAELMDRNPEIRITVRLDAHGVEARQGVSGASPERITDLTSPRSVSSGISPERGFNTSDIADDATQTDMEPPVVSSASMVTKEMGIETDFQSQQISDELERLRRERKRILDMLAKDVFPSKFQVEIAEAQLNYMIGQTDTLLSALDAPHGGTDELILLGEQLSHPEHQLSQITQRHLSKYRQQLESSRRSIESRIERLETEQHRVHKSRSRQRHIAQMRRNAQIEAFNMERKREQVTYSRVKSLSPGGEKPAADEKAKDGSSSGSANGQIKFTPKLMKDKLVSIRKGLVRASHHDRLHRSLSPARQGYHENAPHSYHDDVRPSASYEMYSPRLSPGRYSSSSPYRPAGLEYAAGRRTASHSPYRHGVVGDDDVDSIISSLPDETQDLLYEYQQTRGRTKDEIARAKADLQARPNLLATSPARRPASSRPELHRNSYSSNTMATTNHRPSYSTETAETANQRSALDKTNQNNAGSRQLAVNASENIDDEIERMRKKYGLSGSSSVHHASPGNGYQGATYPSPRTGYQAQNLSSVSRLPSSRYATDFTGMPSTYSPYSDYSSEVPYSNTRGSSYLSSPHLDREASYSRSSYATSAYSTNDSEPELLRFERSKPISAATIKNKLERQRYSKF